MVYIVASLIVVTYAGLVLCLNVLLSCVLLCAKHDPTVACLQLSQMGWSPCL